MKIICNDLKNEQEELDSIVSNFDENMWNKMTKFADWTVKDEISHLAYFDSTAKLAAIDRNAFVKSFEEMIKGITNPDEIFKKTLEKGRKMTYSQLLEWWREERYQLVNALIKLEPKKRLPWYGPDMSAKSFATARLMETWAHGQDILDTFNIPRNVNSRLKHIAHLGVKTFGWSYVNRNLEIPEKNVRVELHGLDNENLEWGSEDSEEFVKGNILDFCLVVTKRRHLDDTKLITKGEIARDWMIKSQAFAGPPVDGPLPEKFNK